MVRQGHSAELSRSLHHPEQGRRTSSNADFQCCDGRNDGGNQISDLRLKIEAGGNRPQAYCSEGGCCTGKRLKRTSRIVPVYYLLFF